MEILKKSFVLSICLLLVLSLIVGCSAQKSENSTSDRGSSEYPASPPMPTPSEPEAGKDSDFGGGMVPSPLEPSKVITTVNLSFETMEFEKTSSELNKLIEKYQAYVEYSNISYNRYYDSKNYRYGEYIIRVPRENIISFRTESNQIGNLINESTNKQDVTKYYTDTESRLRVVEIKEERILSLLERAERIEDIIQLENQLSNVIQEKESLKSNLINLDDKIDFSTLNVNIQEVEKISNTETIETTFGTKVKNAIDDSLYFFKTSLERLIILGIYIIPFLVIIAVFLYIVFIILKKANKKKGD